MNKKGDIFDSFGIFVTIIILIGLIALAIYGIVYASTSGTEQVTFKEKWVKYHSGDAKYLVSSTDGQVFEISDSYWYWRFDSSNLYSEIEIGEICTLKTQGFRFPFMSDYKNIIEINDCINIGADING